MALYDEVCDLKERVFLYVRTPDDHHTNTQDSKHKVELAKVHTFCVLCKLTSIRLFIANKSPTLSLSESPVRPCTDNRVGKCF